MPPQTLTAAHTHDSTGGAGGPSSAAPPTRSEATRSTFERLARTSEPLERVRLRDEIVMLNLPMARSIALRYRDRGEVLEDLVQVAVVGLLKAVDGFDPGRGTDFAAYASPTISGEIKRHFRDRGWAIKPPRRIQEMRLALTDASAQLTQELGRAPTVQELANRLDACPEDVLEALTAARGFVTESLDCPGAGAEDDVPLGERLGDYDAGFDQVEYVESLQPLLARLPERERRILVLRFYRHWTQSQIAAEIGISQMQVSRLLSRTLERLRFQLSR